MAIDTWVRWRGEKCIWFWYKSPQCGNMESNSYRAMLYLSYWPIQRAGEWNVARSTRWGRYTVAQFFNNVNSVGTYEFFVLSRWWWRSLCLRWIYLHHSVSLWKLLCTLPISRDISDIYTHRRFCSQSMRRAFLCSSLYVLILLNPPFFYTPKGRVKAANWVG